MTQVSSTQEPAERSGADEVLRGISDPTGHVVELFGTL